MFICTNCNSEFTKWQGQCTKCQQWNTIEEIKVSKPKGKKSKDKSDVRPVKLSDLDEKSSSPSNNIKTTISEFDNTVGGSIIPGQAILLGGSPGVGKSTLSLQITQKLSDQNKKILYVCGEESPTQIKQRASRLGLSQENVLFYPEMNIEEIERYVSSHTKKIDFLFFDSIQTLYSNDATGGTGSVSQISECTNKIVNLAKGFNIPAIVIGHITKSGDIAGPKIMEHMVDTVLYFEGDTKHQLRMLRVQKNRYGPTDEVGIFKMDSKGLREVKDTKELFDPNKKKAAGAVYCMTVEGNRPMVVEVQALATKTYFNLPRRASSGFEISRLHILLAIIDKVLKLKTYEYDIYVNITGGFKIKDTAMDLAVIQAIVSSIKNVPAERENVYFGEVGLTGEIRKVFLQDKREKEAKRLGFKNIICNKNLKEISALK